MYGRLTPSDPIPSHISFCFAVSTGKRLGSMGFDTVNVDAKAQLVQILNAFLDL